MTGTPPTVVVDVASVFSETGTAESFSGSVEVPELRVGSERFAFEGPVAYDLSLSNAGALVMLGGSVTGVASATCSRCLEPFRLDLVGEVETYFVAPGGEDDLPDDVDYEIVGGDTIDLWPALAAALAVAAPFAPVHDEECLGICAGCGADLNEGPCDCPQERSDSPFDVLRGMLEDGRDGGDDPA